MKKALALALSIFFAAAIAIVLLPHRHEATFYPMGGIPFKVIAYGRNYFQFDRDLAAVEGRVGRLRNIFDIHDEESELSILNEDASIGMFWPSEDISRVIEMSRRWHRNSGGAFDPSILPVLRLWKEAARRGVLPGDIEISDALQLVDLDRVESVDFGKLRFATAGMGLDFGGIAKGYIVDEAVAVLKSRGVVRGVIEAGGDAYAFGDGEFKFGIRDPTVKSADAIIGSVMVPEGAIATSGDYERYAEIGGRRFSHIVDPRSGWPVENEIASVTIIGGSAADADALATAVMVLGLGAGRDLIARLPEYRAVIIVRSGDGYDIYAFADIVSSLSLVDEWKRNLKPF